MMKKKTILASLTLAGTLLLSACGGGEDPLKTRNNDYPFDGMWSGLISLNIGDDSCMRREKFVIRVQEGRITGKTRNIKYKTEIEGFVEDDGTIDQGLFVLGTKFRDAEMVGKFEGNEARGTWESRRCKGSWELRHVR